MGWREGIDRYKDGRRKRVTELEEGELLGWRRYWGRWEKMQQNEDGQIEEWREVKWESGVWWRCKSMRRVRGAGRKWAGGRGNQGQRLDWKEWMWCRNGRKKRSAISHQESFTTSGPLPPLALWLRLTTVCTHMQTREIYGNHWSSVDLKIRSALQLAHESCILFQVRNFN